MNKLAIASLACMALATSSAFAADLPVKAPPVAAVFSWTGCYVGAYGGGAEGARYVNAVDPTAGTRFYSANATTANAGAFSYPLAANYMGGGTLGCNWQAGSLVVLGAEAEGGYLNLKRSAVDPYSNGGDTTSTTRIGNWYGAATGRIGFVADTLLLYFKGGIGAATLASSVVDTCATAPCSTNTLNATYTQTRSFGVIGGGFEKALNANWSIKAEYLWLALSTRYQVCGAGGGSVAGLNFCSQHSIDGIHTAKVGLNYRFNWGSPVVASY
jgi:outer membrane immunogenic protein